MVRIVSVSALGYDDYGGHFSDRGVDGVDYTDAKEKPEKSESQELTVKVQAPVKLKGGRKSQ